MAASKRNAVSRFTRATITGAVAGGYGQGRACRCQDKVVRVGRTVLLPIDAAEAALLSLTAETTQGVDDEDREGEQPTNVDAVLASVNMERTHAR
jgi:hypothetical protein